MADLVPNNLFANVPEAAGQPPVDPVGKAKTDESKLPDELKGKSPGEVYDLLVKEHNDEIETLRTTMVKPEESNEAQRKDAPAYNPSYVPGGGFPAQQQQQQQQQEEPDIVTNPDGFMDAQFNRRMGPLVTATVQAQRETNRRLFAANVGKEEYAKRKDEIEALVDNLAPQMQMRPDAYDTAHNFVIAAHKDEIIEEEATKKATGKLVEILAARGLDENEIADAIKTVNPTKEVPQSLFAPRVGVKSTVPVVPHIESGNGASGGRVPTRKPRLTNDEKQLAIEFGMTDDEWVESKAQNTDVVSMMEAGQ